MNCLCCGKPLRSDDIETGWHKGCIKRFFGTARLPEIELDEKAIELLATESTNKGYTVPGVQKKLSLHSGYILKPQVEDFEALPEAEQLVMCMADAVGISTAPHALIMGKGNGSLAYITKRVDRIFNKDNVQMLAMEDFCQLDLRLTQDKYKGSYERCAKIINKYSSRKGLDMTELYIRLVFSFIVGNSDMHLKNFSLLETKEGSGIYLLSPAYDLFPVNVILSEDEEQFALVMNGKKMNIQRNDFLIFADECGIPHNSAVKMIAMLVSKKDKLIEMCRNSLLPEYLKERFITLMETRIKILEN